MSLASAALAYAKAGRKVFPCSPREKTPLIPKSQGGRGHHDATCDLVDVANWWAFWPDANIGLSCAASGLAVIDIDPRNSGEDGWQEVLCHQPDGQFLPRTREVETGGGGFHIYFDLPGLPEKHRWNGKLAKGVDLKVDGYVLAPPSVHPSGELYRWRNSFLVASMPWWLAQLCWSSDEPVPYVSPPDAVNRAPWFCRAALERETARVGRAPHGERNETLNSAAFNLGGLIHLGLAYDVVEEHLLVAACTWNDVPLREARKTIRSGLQGGMRKPRGIPER